MKNIVISEIPDTPSVEVSNRIEDILSKISTLRRKKDRLRMEIWSGFYLRLLEDIQDGIELTKAERSLLDDTEPVQYADEYNRLEAELPFFMDPKCLWIILASILSYTPIYTVFQYMIYSVFQPPATSSLFVLHDIMEVVIYAAPPLVGLAAYHLYVHVGGNIHRWKPFVGVGVVCTLLAGGVTVFPAMEGQEAACRFRLLYPDMTTGYISGMFLFYDSDGFHFVRTHISLMFICVTVISLLGLWVYTIYAIRQRYRHATKIFQCLLLMLLSCAGLQACGRTPEPTQAQVQPVVSGEKQILSVRDRFIDMLNSTRYLTNRNKRYKAIIRMGKKAIPGLKEVALDQSIQGHWIAYKMLGEIRDRSVIPFMMEALNHSNSRDVRMNAVWGLDCLLGFGIYNWDDPNADQIEKTYLLWWKEHKHEFDLNS